MYRLVATDVDGVVKPYHDPVPREISDLLKKISQHCRIIFLSGRQITWLDGLILGMGLRPNRTILVGEEGSVIYFPDEVRIIYALEKDELKKFQRIRNSLKDELERSFGDKIFIPCTRVILTMAAGEYFEEVDNYVKKFLEKNHAKNLCRLIYHRMHNVIQVFPVNVDKYVSLRRILAELGISDEEVIALGDGLNDIPMLQKAGLSIAVGDNPEVKRAAKVHFEDPIEAFSYVLKIIRRE
ncbi:MAG: HAD family hydrolase [Candidatus Njordarchaeales archaeon]